MGGKASEGGKVVVAISSAAPPGIVVQTDALNHFGDRCAQQLGCDLGCAAEADINNGALLEGSEQGTVRSVVRCVQNQYPLHAG